MKKLDKYRSRIFSLDFYWKLFPLFKSPIVVNISLFFFQFVKYICHLSVCEYSYWRTLGLNLTFIITIKYGHVLVLTESILKAWLQGQTEPHKLSCNNNSAHFFYILTKYHDLVHFCRPKSLREPLAAT